MKLPFHLVDVFAEHPLEGNQLAVFRCLEEPSTREMQRIALEMNFSESTFITGEDITKRVFKVRIFTPRSELPFAGHPTLGTAWVIQQSILGDPVPDLTLDVKAGLIPVRFSYESGRPGVLWMRQLPPQFGPVHDTMTYAVEHGLDPSVIDARYPVQDVSTGIWFTMVPIKGRENLKALKQNPRLAGHSGNPNARSPFFWCLEPESPVNHLKVRLVGAGHEDPATGSANGCLAGYLAKHRILGSSRVDARVEQGAEISRPSLLYIKAEEKPDGIEVNVGGRVYPVAEGTLV